MGISRFLGTGWASIRSITSWVGEWVVAWRRWGGAGGGDKLIGSFGGGRGPAS